MQQATINLPSNSPVRAMSGLARALSLPAEGTPQRLPSFPQLERSAIMGFNQPLAMAVGASDPVKVVLTRDAAFPFWHSATTLANGCWSATYALNTVADEASINWAYSSYDHDPTSLYTQSGGGATSRAAGVTGGSVVTTQIPLGLDEALGTLPFVFIPSNMAVGIGVVYPAAATVAPVGCGVLMEEWKHPGEVQSMSVGLLTLPLPAVGNTGGGAVYARFQASTDNGVWLRIRSLDIQNAAAATPPSACYLTIFALPDSTAAAPTFVPAVGGVGSWTIPTSNQRVLLPYGIAPEYSTSIIPYSGTRLTAVAALMTNVTQVLNKAGTVLAGRINPENVPGSWAQVTQEVINALHPAEKAWLPLETGLYTYAPPGVDIGNFVDYTLQTGGYAVPVYRLDNASLVNVAFLTSPAAFELAVTLTTHIEFRTSSALWTLGVSGYTLETLHIAQMALMTCGFFFENPEHKSLLMRVSAGIRKLEPYVTPLVAAAKVVHPPTGAALSAAYNAARAFTKAAEKTKPTKNTAPRKVTIKAGPMKVQTTTAAKSGMLGPQSGRGRRKK